MAFTVSYLYEIINKYTPTLTKIQTGTKYFMATANKAATATSNFSNKLMSMQGFASAAAGALGGTVAVRSFLSYEEAMNKLNAVTLASGEEMEVFRGRAKELGATTQFTAGEVANGMSMLALAGMEANQIYEAIPKTLNLAAAAGLEMSEAADIATNVLGQMNLEVSDLADVNDILAMSQASANYTVQELFESMKTSATVARLNGLNLSETAAALGVMADAGNKGSIAGTRFKNMMLEMTNASETQKGLYRALGVDLDQYISKTGKITDLGGFIDEFKALSDAGRMSSGLLNALFGMRGQEAMGILMTKGSGALDEFIDKMDKAGGVAEKMADIRMSGLPGVLKEVRSAAEALNIAIFEQGGLSEFLIGKLQTLTSWLRKMSATSPGLLKTIAGLGFFTVVSGPILMGIGMISMGLSGLFASFGFLCKPVLFLGKIFLWFFSVIFSPAMVVAVAFVAVGAAVYQLIKHWDTLFATDAVSFFRDLAGWLTEISGINFTAAFEYFEGLLKDIKTIAGPGFWSDLWGFAGDSFDIIIDGIVNRWKESIEDLKAFFIDAVAKMMEDINKVVGFFERVKGTVVGDEEGGGFMQNIKDFYSSWGDLPEVPININTAGVLPEVPININTAGVLPEGPINVDSAGILPEGTINHSVAAKNQTAVTSTLNGKIVVSAEPGSSVEGANMNLDMPGNLGMNLGY